VRTSRQAHYRSLDKMGRKRARRVAWSGAPSGDDVIDAAAYECLRSSIGGPVCGAILCALIGFFFLFVRHRYVAGFGMLYSTSIAVGAAIYVGYRAWNLSEAEPGYSGGGCLPAPTRMPAGPPSRAQCRLAKGARDSSARSRDVGSHPAARRIAVIPKTFIMAKEIRAMRVKSLRANKILRDHGAIPASVR